MRGKWIFMLIVLAMLICAASTKPIKLPKGYKLVKSLPPWERKQYLAFSLGRGYTQTVNHLARSRNDKNNDLPFPDGLGIPTKMLNKFQKIEEPEDFTKNLYSYVHSTYNLNQDMMRTLILRKKICFINGHCIDMDDIGSLCCPF